MSENYNGTPPEMTDHTRLYSLTAYRRLLPKSTTRSTTRAEYTLNAELIGSSHKTEPRPEPCQLIRQGLDESV
jgi:hypothetical protein